MLTTAIWSLVWEPTQHMASQTIESVEYVLSATSKPVSVLIFNEAPSSSKPLDVHVAARH